MATATAPNSSKKLFKLGGPLWFLNFASKEDYVLYIFGIISAILCGSPIACIDYLYGYWTNGLITHSPTGGASQFSANEALSRSIEVACIMIAVMAYTALAGMGFWWCWNLVSARISAKIRVAFLRSVLSQEVEHFQSHPPGAISNTLSNDITLLAVGMGEKLGMLVWALTSFFTGIILSFALAPKLAGVLFGLLPLSGACFYLANWFTDKSTETMSPLTSRAAGFAEEVLSSIRVVKSLGAEKTLVDVYDTFLKQIETEGGRKALAKGFGLASSYFCLFLTYAVTFWWGANQVAYGGLAIGTSLTSFFSIFNAMFALVNILPHITSLSDALAAQRRIREEVERVSGIDVRDTSGIILPLPSSENSVNREAGLEGVEIEFKNVDFYYPSRPTIKVLDNFSAVFEKGKVTALVGSSGSGKSTVTSLLLRQFDLPSSTSQITIDSHPIRSINLASLRSTFSIVSQSVDLMSGTVFKNVAIGLTGTPLELTPTSTSTEIAHVRMLVQEALVKAQAWGFVSRLPKGIDTIVSGRKVGNFSGGQKQRIAIARALVRKSRVLIFDEGTSALDTQSEKALQLALAKEQAERGMTIILIAHRLSTVRDADKIIVVSTGRVAQYGTHEELLERGGEYKEMLLSHHYPITSSQDQEQTLTPPSPSSILSKIDTEEKIGSKETSEYLLEEESTVAEFAKDTQMAEDGTLTERTHVNQATVLKRYFQVLGQQSKFIIPGIASAVVVGSSFTISAWMFGKGVAVFQISSATELVHQSLKWALYFFILSVCNLVLLNIEGYCLENTGQRLTRRLRREGLFAILRQEVGFFEQDVNGSGSLTSSVTDLPAQVAAGGVGLVLGTLLHSLCNVLGSIALGLALNWKVSLVAYSSLVLLIPIAWGETHYLEKYEAAIDEYMSKATDFAIESVEIVKTVAAFGRESAIVNEYENIQKPDWKTQRNTLFAASFWFGASQSTMPFLCLLLFYYGGAQLGRNQITTDELYATFEAAAVAGFSSSRIFSFIGDIGRAAHSFQIITEWLNRQPIIPHLRAAGVVGSESDKTTKSISSPLGPEITLSQVYLQYPSRKESVALQGIDLHIKSGQTIALCGPSGGGKSSMLAVIARFYEPTTGTVKIDGVDVRSTTLEEHYGRISLVSQDAILYQGTIRFNLLLGVKRDISEGEIEQACRDAAIWDFVDSLPDRLESFIGMKGLQLSGGERQRLCIARALLRETKILLLDESTAALDNESEHLVQKALDRAAANATCIIVAHRLSTIRNADVIYVIEEGRIVEAGTHSELLAQQKRYFSLVEAQL